MRIPTREEHRSMNLGQAVAVCLYELTRDPKSSFATKKQAFATAGSLELLTSLLFEVLQDTGYLKNSKDREKARSTSPAEEGIRRFIRRTNLSGSDAELLLGMLRQILWKLRS